MIEKCRGVVFGKVGTVRGQKMKFEELHIGVTVFSYHVSPVFGREGDYGGFSLTLYGNGNLKYCRYKLFDKIDGAIYFKLSKETVKEIYDAITAYEDRLRDLPQQLDYEQAKTSGVFQEFCFLDAMSTCTWNAKRHSMVLERMKNKERYRLYHGLYRYENIILELFDQICTVMKKEDITLSLSGCKGKEEFKLKVTFKGDM